MHLAWNTRTDEAFEKLKTEFTTAPILKPDPLKPFIAEHASESWVDSGHTESIRHSTSQNTP